MSLIFNVSVGSSAPVRLTNGYILIRAKNPSTGVERTEIMPQGFNMENKPTIGPNVTEIGWNSRFILAKNTSKYYILDSSILMLYGGYDYERFLEAKKTLKISDDLILKSVNNYL